jgi:hypothetical protein
MPDILVDNDVVLKSCCYGIDEPFLDMLDRAECRPLVLAVARYVIERRIRRSRSLLDPERAHASFRRLIGRLLEVEPSEAELAMAAEFEAVAQQQNLELDGGESQLLAMLIQRKLPLLLTGDKRAIVAIECIAADMLPRPSIACLEQTMMTLLVRIGLAALRERVCSEPAIDRALATCFACHSIVVEVVSVEEGLRSYINHLRRSSSHTLLTEDDLSFFVP